MKNTYITSHFPLISIILYSTSLSIYTEMELIKQLKNLGIYEGMLEFFSENGIKLSLFVLLALLFFMVFSALKLIADTVIGLSLLFFSKDAEGRFLNKFRTGSSFYLISGALSLLSVQHILGIAGLFAGTTLIYFIYFVYKVSASLSLAGLIGMVFYHVIFWFTFFLGIVYLGVKLYNSFLASLPI